MGTFQNFEEIEVWRKARESSRLVYRVSSLGSFARDYGLMSYLRKCGLRGVKYKAPDSKLEL